MCIRDRLTRNLTEEQITEAGFEAYFVDHTTGVFPQFASGYPWSASTMQVTGDTIADLTEDLAAEQKARVTYDNILRLSDDPDVNDVIKFLRAREIVHFQRFGEGLRLAKDRLDEKNVYYVNPVSYTHLGEFPHQRCCGIVTFDGEQLGNGRAERDVYKRQPQLSENREETTETIVPDYLPDIARIVDASGCLFLRSREIADGKAQVSGTVRMTLLYVAEDAQGMKSFEYTLPLDETIEGRALSGSADSCLDGRLCSCEVRMLNPRKVFTRVNVELTLTPYVPASLSVCSGVKEQEAYKIETLCEKKDIGIIRAIREKDFTCLLYTSRCV